MADPRSSSLSQVPGSPAEEGLERSQRLTEQERKANHISSEQKRRLHIREGFERIAQLVPGMAGQERSEGVVLCGTVDYLKKLLQERRAMIGALEANGMNVEPHLKK
ncbi:hypothetical protein C8A05DRAFT_16994 [Staphylotrichum tortipilum]|uniref:BHLH domain-containing protein n=1 Tax=Staphylotrichum tortipilum TaxID=2831512 RepID=A0AAN6MH03_9PEZI|nr:hypothetical protein C8A05DRAFT_16994 [Staphylotrichum longicolle]